MKKAWWILIITLIILFLFFYFKGYNLFAKENLTCFMKGGKIEMVQGYTGLFPACVHRYSDGGKPCNSSEECLGDCIANSAGLDKSPIVFCEYTDNHLGECVNTIERYNRDGALICRD